MSLHTNPLLKHHNSVNFIETYQTPCGEIIEVKDDGHLALLKYKYENKIPELDSSGLFAQAHLDILRYISEKHLAKYVGLFETAVGMDRHIDDIAHYRDVAVADLDIANKTIDKLEEQIKALKKEIEKLDDYHKTAVNDGFKLGLEAGISEQKAKENEKIIENLKEMINKQENK